jgi:hypothetical protein
MKTRTPALSKYAALYAVGCEEAERPYNRVQIVFLRLLGIVLGRHIV